MQVAGESSLLHHWPAAVANSVSSCQPSLRCDGFRKVQPGDLMASGGPGDGPNGALSKIAWNNGTTNVPQSLFLSCVGCVLCYTEGEMR